jgi:hypothetical protein
VLAGMILAVLSITTAASLLNKAQSLYRHWAPPAPVPKLAGA